MVIPNIIYLIWLSQIKQFHKGDNNMPDYKQMYLTLLDATEKAINVLVSAQRACEEQYILSSEEEEKAKKTESIRIKEK